MDHNEAVRLQAAEKYLSGEFTRAQRDEYEEHYFDCPTCAEELKATVAFMESAKQVTREFSPQTNENKGFSERKAIWLAWLRPAFAVPAFAALLLVVVYQNSVTIPRLQESPSSPSAQIITATVRLSGSVRGGSEGDEAGTKVQVHPGQSFILDFDFTPSRAFSSYRWELRDADGGSVKKGVLAGDNTNRTVHLAALGGVQHSGRYSLVFLGEPDGKSQSASETEVQQIAFSVEFPR